MEEIRYFGRISLYALVVGVIYWFLSYEAAGTALLIGFGLATGGAFLVLRSGAPAGATAPSRDHDHGHDEREQDTLEGGAGTERGEGYGVDVASTRADGPFADESGPVPTRSAAPLSVGFGLAAIALAGAFGPWFIIAGAVPLLLGAADWLRSAERELALRASIDEASAPDAEGRMRADRGIESVEAPAAKGP